MVILDLFVSSQHLNYYLELFHGQSKPQYPNATWQTSNTIEKTLRNLSLIFIRINPITSSIRFIIACNWQTRSQIIIFIIYLR